MARLLPSPAQQHVDFVRPLQWSEDEESVDIWGIARLRPLMAYERNINGSRSSGWEGDIPRGAIQKMIARVNVYLAQVGGGDEVSTRSGERWERGRRRIEALRRRQREVLEEEDRVFNRRQEELGGALTVEVQGAGARRASFRPPLKRQLARYPYVTVLAVTLLLLSVLIVPMILHFTGILAELPIDEATLFNGIVFFVLVTVVFVPTAFFFALRPSPVELLVQNGRLIVEEKRLFGKSFSTPLSSVSLRLELHEGDQLFRRLLVTDGASGVESTVVLTPDEVDEIKRFFKGLKLEQSL